MAFEKVTRQRAKLRMALTGVSGAGKTLGALYIAYGITNDWGKIALIDTEHERARFYANRSDLGTGEFLYSSFAPPYSPERYKALVSEGATAVGPDGVVIVDSFSHAWNNEGGILDLKEAIAAQKGKNSYTAWQEAGKEQNSLVNTILSADCHVIVTMRSKMEYALQENERGKMEPRKMGLAPIQREDTEYEFDIVLDIARNHIATASKDTTFLDRFGAIITPQLGRDLADWLNSGAVPNSRDQFAELDNDPNILPEDKQMVKETIQRIRNRSNNTLSNICKNCGKPIANHHRMTADKIIENTVKKFGRPLCWECACRLAGVESKVKANATAAVSDGTH